MSFKVLNTAIMAASYHHPTRNLVCGSCANGAQPAGASTTPFQVAG
jgi:hypothetical protein